MGMWILRDGKPMRVSLEEILLLIQRGEITSDTQASYNGKEWGPLSEQLEKFRRANRQKILWKIGILVLITILMAICWIRACS